jgi:membrane protease YdiL (CAAX protease family)
MELYTAFPNPAGSTVFSAGHYAAQAAQHPVRTFLQQVIAPRFWLFASLIVLVLGMQVAFLYDPVYGVYATATALAACLIIALCSPAARMVAIATACIPVAYMVSLCVAQPHPLFRSAVLYASLFALTLVYRLQFGLARPGSYYRLGFGGYMRLLPAMLVLGQLFGVLMYGGLRGLYPYAGSSVGMVVGVAVLFASTEELFFRGLLQPSAAKAMHPGMAAVLSATLFACLSIGTGQWVNTGIAFAMGLVLAAVYYKNQHVLLTMTLNITAKLVFLGALATLTWGYF